jgi:hypothetical protein
MMRRLCLIAGLLYIGIPAWCQNSYYFPFAADGASGDGTVRTSILITNPGPRAAKVALTWTNDDGSARQVALPDLGSDSSFALVLAPGATRILQTSGGGDASAGAAVVSSDQFLTAWGVLSAYDSSGSLKGETTFAAAASSTGFRVPVDSSTSIALYNPGPADASVAANLIDASGATIASQTLTLAGGSRVSQLVFGDWFASVDSFRGALELKSTVPLAAQVLRKNGTLAAVLEATPLVSKRMNFYLPRLADGPSIASTLRTTFLFTNLSAKPANVSVALVRDDGSPWTVAIPGMDPNSTFQTALDPGASTLWQTDGSGPYATGAAAIRSDGPIGVQALVTAYDAQGAILSETAAVDARLRQQFTLPFDTTTGLSPGAVFYNPGSRPVTLALTLRDGDGSVAGTAQTGPIAPGGSLTGGLLDFFPGAAIPRGALQVNTGGPFVSALSVRQNQGQPWSTTLAAGAVPLTGVPIPVTTTVDDKRAATASIGAKGGSLSVTDAAGNKFTLTIPPSALFATEKIVMTPVTAAKGVPGSGLIAVQLAPDGLALLQPATLAIQSTAAQATLTPIGWFGASSPGIYLNPPQPKASQLTMLLTHFSNAGAANLTPGDLTSILLNIVDLQAYYQSQAAAALKAQSADDFAAAFDAEWEQVIEPLIEAALSSQDDNVIQCAIYHALAYQRQAQLLGADPQNVIGAAIADFMTAGRHILIEHAKKRCTDDHDFTALMDILSLLRQDQLLGGNEPIPDYTALQAQCPYQLQFDFVSLILSHYPGVGYFKGQVSASVPLNGEWDKTVLTSVTDPTVDLFASYQLSNIGQNKYDTFAFDTTEEMAGCTIVANGLRPGKMSVVGSQPDGKKSQVQFMFTAGYNPVPYSQSGVQLCAFCPVYSKKLVKVDILINPGLNWEDITHTCPLVGAEKITELFWNDGWDTLHPVDLKSGLYYFPNWEVVVTKDMLAQIKLTTSVTAPDHSSVDSTSMKLTRVALP